VDRLRCKMLHDKCGGNDMKFHPQKNVELITVPPLRVCLQEHIKRVIYQVAIWKRLCIHNSVIPTPTDGNGWVMVEQNIEPKWHEGDVLPPQMADTFWRHLTVTS